MATHSSVLAWRIPGTEEPGGLLSGVAQSRTGLKQLSSSSSKGTEVITGSQSLHCKSESHSVMSDSCDTV